MRTRCQKRCEFEVFKNEFQLVFMFIYIEKHPRLLSVKESTANEYEDEP